MANSGHTFFRNIFALLNKALHIAGSSVAATHTVRAYDNRKNSGIALSRSVAAAHCSRWTVAGYVPSLWACVCMRVLFDFAFVGEKALLQFATVTQVASDELRRRCGTEIVTHTYILASKCHSHSHSHSHSATPTATRHIVTPFELQVFVLNLPPPHSRCFTTVTNLSNYQLLTYIQTRTHIKTYDGVCLSQPQLYSHFVFFLRWNAKLCGFLCFGCWVGALISLLLLFLCRFYLHFICGFYVMLRVWESQLR